MIGEKKSIQKTKNQQLWTKKIKENKMKRSLFERRKIKHPLHKDNLKISQQLMRHVLSHPSMPKSKFIPDFGKVDEDNNTEYDEVYQEDFYPSQKQTYQNLFLRPE